MNSKFFAIALLLSVLISASTYAQFGKILKEVSKTELGDKAKQFAKDKLAEEFERKRDEFDTTSFNYAIAFLDKAGMYEHREKGENVTRMANNFLQSSKPKTEAEKARGLLDLGELSYGSGKYALAELYLQAAKYHYELNNNTTEPNYYKSIANLGLLYNNQGRYSQAEEYTINALELRKDNLGENSMAYASSLNNKAVLDFDLGKYNEAEKLIDQAKQITAAGLGKESMAYAIHLNNQAIFFNAMGRYDQAIQLMQECLKIAEKELKEKSATLLQLMTNLALMQQSMGRYEDAEKTYLTAIKLQENRLKLNAKNDPDYAHMLNNLASLYMETKRYDEALSLLEKSLEIYQNKFGNLNPATAAAMSDLGNFHLSQGQYEKAAPLLTQAFNSRKATLSDNHPAYVKAEEDVAILKWKQGELNEAMVMYEGVMEKSMDFLEHYFPPMSEAEKTKYWDQLRPRFHRYYSFSLSAYDKHPELVDKLLEYHLATKGLLLSTNNRIKQAILNSGDAELIQLYTDWQEQKDQLAAYYTYSKEELRDQKVNLDSIENAANRSERQLSERSADFASNVAQKRIKTADLQSILKNKEAIVEMLQIPWFENQFTDEVRYAAIVIKPTGSAQLTVIENGVELENRYYKYYKNVIRQKLKDQNSYTQYWKPLETQLAGISKIYFSPDGIYNQINVNTLLKNDGSFVINQTDIYLVGNAKDLLQKSRASNNKQAFVLGYPEFGDAKLVAPLPGTLEETTQIASKLKGNTFEVQKFTGNTATEGNVKAMQAPGLVHIATHGFFQEDVSGANQKVFGVNVESAKNNPLLRSGLLLTGAAYTVKDETFRGFDVNDNGILTAYEAMNLPLNNTNLVVLSACETGVGDVKAGEGVYGLQRAFMVAGASQLIMSLWKVSDEATQHLMTAFYQQWLSGKDTQQAFRSAQLSLKNKYPHPYFWGAFVMVNTGS